MVLTLKQSWDYTSVDVVLTHIPETLGSIPVSHKLSMTVHTCNPSPQDCRGKMIKVQGYPQLFIEFEASLRYVGPRLPQPKKFR